MKSHFLKAYCLLLIALLLFGQADLTLVGLSNANSADTNIAIGRSVTVSSVWDDPEGAWRSRFLTDGSKMESWPLPEGESLGWRSQKYSRREVSITATVDLEGKASVCGIKLYPRGNGAICFPSDYELSLSIDGSQWQSVATVTGDTLRNEVRAFDFPSEHARYVRLTVTRLSEEKDGNDRVCEISEFEIYGSYTKELILMKDNLWLSVGGNERLLPSSVNTNLDSVAYTSLDPSVAAVSEDGTVTGMSEGSTEITVADEAGGLSATCTVKVGGKKPSNIMITVPVWGNEFAITKQQFAWMQEADIDGVMAVGPDNSAENADKMLSIAQEIWDPALERNLGVFIYTHLNGITPDSSDKEITDLAEKYRNTLAFMGYHITDEPRDPMPYARLEQLLKQADPDSIADINFLPGFVYSDYEEYYNLLADYAKVLGEHKSYLSFDNYPFTPTAGTVNEEQLFNNFETVRRAGMDTDTPTAFYLQAVGSSHFGYRRPTENDLRYHIATGLSYGFKWIKYYSWFVPGATGTGEDQYYTDAIIDHEGNKTELYDVAAALNREVHNVGDILVQLNTEEVYHSGSRSSSGAYQKIPTDFFVQPQNNEYAIVSLMKNPISGKEYLMIVNKDITKEATLSFRLTGVDFLTEIDKSVKNGTLTPSYSNGILTRTFAPGEFALYELNSQGNGKEDTVNADSNLLRDASAIASASATSRNWSIAYAHDGIFFSQNSSMGWRVNGTAANSPTIIFDLKTKKEFSRLDIYPAGNGAECGVMFPHAFELLTSDDGKEWKSVCKQTDIPKPTYDVPVFTFARTSGRYVKIVFASTYSFEVAELALYSDSDSAPTPEKTSYSKPKVKEGENIALGKQVSASANYTDNVWNPSFTTDGVKMASWPTNQTLGWNGGFYSNRTLTEPIYLTVNLGAIYTIKRVVLYPRGNGGICFPSDYEIQVSTNGLHWKTVYSATNDVSKGERKRTINFISTEALYVRLKVTVLGLEQDNLYSCQISEFEVYGPATPTEPDVPDTPDVPDNPDTPDEPDTPDTPDVPDTPDTPDVPDTPDEPYSPPPICSSQVHTGICLTLFLLAAATLRRKDKNT